MNKTITNALDNFSQGALCTWLNRPGATAAVSTLALGAITVPDPVTTAAGLGLLATQAACAFNPNPSPDAGNWEGEFVNVCGCDNKNGYNEVYTVSNTGFKNFWLSLAGAKEFEFRSENPQPGDWRHYCKGKYCANTTGEWDFEVTQANSTSQIIMEQQADTSLPCVGNPVKPAPTPPAEPITGESEELGCTLTADLGAWIQSPNGTTVPVIKYSSQASGGGGVRADGGVISGCNWYGDLVYIGGDGDGPPRVVPFPPGEPWPPEGPGIPDWLQDLLSSLASNVLYDQLAKLYATPLSGATYQLIAPCEEFEPGEPKKITVVIPTLPTNLALATRIEALIPILQGQKDFKQPLCPPAAPEGEFRTIGFISEEVSPNGKSCLRKRFRYRSLSGLGLDSVIDWWKDFQFSAGPVIVQHRGASWGSVKCWASSADEGKRVIRHAAGEAGFDADKVGRWEISGSSSSRLGMPGTMKVNQTGGYYWITARDGSDNRPLVGKT